MDDYSPPETTNQPYDVFLSHNSKDKPAVETLAVRLTDEARLRVWLDKWNLIPGEPWQEEIERALDQAHTCAVFLGPHEFGGWHHEEMRAALNRRVADRTPKFRVIPVLLPGQTFITKLPKQPLDGELWIGRGQFENLSGAVRKTTPQDDEWRQIKYMVFELPDAPEMFAERADSQILGFLLMWIAVIKIAPGREVR